MKEPYYHIELDDNEHSAVIKSLNESRNQCIAEGVITLWLINNRIFLL